MATDEHTLWLWGEKQKQAYKEGNLSKKKIRLMEAIPGWTWSDDEETELAKLNRRLDELQENQNRREFRKLDKKTQLLTLQRQLADLHEKFRNVNQQ